MQLGLRACFEADVEFLAVVDYLFHHLAHLIHLDRVNHIVLGRVVILLGGLAEAVADFFYAVVENIGETQQQRRADVAHLKLVDNILDVDRHTTLAGRNGHMAALVNRKIIASPAGNVVQLLAVFDAPFSHRQLVYGIVNMLLVCAAVASAWP